MKPKMENSSRYDNVSVLIFGAGGRQALPICRGFYDLGCMVSVYCKSKYDTGYLTKYAHERILFEADDISEELLEYGLKLINNRHFDLVIPLGDKTATFLSEHKNEIREGTKVAVNDWNVFQNVIDKTKTMRICEKHSIPAPRTAFSDDPVNEIKSMGLSYPVVVKPKTGVGSIGFNIVNDEETLIRFLENYDGKNGQLLVQEYIEQGNVSQYGAELFRDRDGIIRAALIAEVARWYPIDGGSRLLSISIHNQEIANICIRLVDALNWNGYANIDLVWDAKEKKAKILELNGRIGASVKLDFLAGVDIARLILENELGYPVSNMMDYEDGKQISCFLADCLWFVKAKNRFNCKPSWFSRWKIKDVIFSWDDPKPTIGFLIMSARAFHNSMNKRKRIT